MGFLSEGEDSGAVFGATAEGEVAGRDVFLPTPVCLTTTTAMAARS